MIINFFHTNIFISWFSTLCRCFSSMSDIVESMSLQRLYELHRKFSFKCSWFVQSNEAVQRQSTVQALQQQQHQQTIQHQQQQQTEEAFRSTEAFDCRRCSASFASNTKLHQHIRDHHAKKSKISTVISTSISTSSPKFFVVSSSWKAITDIIHISPRTSCLTNHVTRLIFTPKPFAVSTSILTSSSSYSCLINHVTRPTFTPKSFAISTSIFTTSFKSYLTVQDLYSIFHAKLKPTSLRDTQWRLSSARSSGMLSHQTQIISYFKSKTELVSMRKCAHSRMQCQSIRISHLTVVSFFANSMVSRTVKDCSSLFSFWSHRSPILGRKSCMIESRHCCLHGMK